MRNGRYATVDTDAMMKMGTSGRIPVPASVLSDLEKGRPELVHDPATGMRISRYVHTGTEKVSVTFFLHVLLLSSICKTTLHRHG